MLVLSILLAVLGAVTAALPGTFNPQGDQFYAPPGSFDTQVVGQVKNLSWLVVTPGTVTLYLRNGSDPNNVTQILLSTRLPNTGSFSFTIPGPPGKLFDILIVSDVNWSWSNYSPFFAIVATFADLVTSTTVSSSTSFSSSLTTTSSTLETQTRATTTTANSAAAATYTHLSPTQQLEAQALHEQRLRLGLGIGLGIPIGLLILAAIAHRHRLGPRWREWIVDDGSNPHLIRRISEPKPAPPYTPATQPASTAPQPLQEHSDFPLESPPPAYDGPSRQLGAPG